MGLKDQLDKFKKQQEQCQSTLSSITSRARPSRLPVPAAISQQKPKHAALVKFSNDTERLQHINSIRKAPVGAQIKRVIDLLFQTRQPFTPQQINEVCYVDMNANKAVFDSLKSNLKVHYDGTSFSYKAKHDVKGKNELLSLVMKYPSGIAAADLKDAYPKVMEDLQALKTSRDIYLFTTGDSQEMIAYPNDLNGLEIGVDDDLKKLFRDIDIPSDFLDVEKELSKIGLKPATNTKERRAAAQNHGISNKRKQRNKKQKINKRTKLTNSHLPELFENL